jgi:glutamate N-acetyltransferase / amino-acid N-acetyltransferase
MINNRIRKIQGGITSPKGFLQAGIHCGIKKKKPDLAFIFSERPATACGVFTRNSFLAAPVIVTKEYLRQSRHKGIVINSGNANCLTGESGVSDARAITRSLAGLMGCKRQQILMCSTGIIGKKLPVKKIENALNVLVGSLTKNNSQKAARAIMTTDTFIKESAFRIKIKAGEITLAGIAKGAGMISPDMATMISVITTDAKISKPVLRKALKDAVECSFNSITIDGDMSTNDTVLVMANGMSGIEIDAEGAGFDEFTAALKALCLELAKMIIHDAEGATKFIEIDIKGAKNRQQAKDIGLKIANSPLFKTMCYGKNPNFGRIAAACGAVRGQLDTGKIDIYLNNKIAVRSGIAAVSALPQSLLEKKYINVTVDLKSGKSGAKIFTSDLSPEYVKINAAYS